MPGRSVRWTAAAWVGLLLAAAPVQLSSQQRLPSQASQVAGLVSDALDLERDERYPEAAETYRAALRLDPVNVSAMLGLERVLKSSKKSADILPVLNRALARDPKNSLLRAIELRTWVATGPADSVSGAAQRWIAMTPDSPDPYREWAGALKDGGKFDEAQTVLTQGAQKVGANALLPDQAQLSGARGQWLESAKQWHTVVAGSDAMVEGSTETLARTPADQRDQIINLLTKTMGDPPARRMAADLLLGWGRPTQAWTLLDAAMPTDRTAAADALERFADRARTIRTPDGNRVRAQALDKLATVATGAKQERARVDAARAYADAGDREAAQKMLERLAADSARAPTGAAAAMVTLIDMLARQGKVEQAEANYREWNGRMTYEEASGLRNQIAWAWILRGDFLTAKTTIADDSSIASLAVRGWMALFNGDLKLATKNFRAAGPLAGTRDEAIKRTQIAGLIQRIGPDSVPEFGKAMYLLAKGDTTAALSQFALAADSLPPREGRADVLMYAGQVAKAKGDHARAQPLLLGVLAADPNSASAPVAEFNLAESYAQAGRARESVQHLEHLILTYPQSALVPEARRLLDQQRTKVRT
jgi:tetratricopeptide (TPR) repeat protein